MTNRAGADESGPGDPPPKGRGYLQTFLSLHLPAVALGFGQGLTTPVLPVLLIKELDVSVGLAAMVFVATMAGGFSASVPVGYAIDRFGRRRILLAGPIVIAASAFLIGFATAGSFALLIVYRYLGGWGSQMWQLSRLTVIADTGGSNRGRLITSMFGIQRAGNLAAPIVGGFVALKWGVYLPFILQGCIVLLAVIPSFRVIQETMPSRARRGAGEPGAPAESFAWRSLLQPPIPAMYTAQIMATITRGGAIGGGTIFLFGVAAYGVDTVTLGVMSSSMALVGIPLTLSAGWMMDKFGRKVTIVPGLTLLGMAMLFLAVTAAQSLPLLRVRYRLRVDAARRQPSRRVDADDGDRHRAGRRARPLLRRRAYGDAGRVPLEPAQLRGADHDIGVHRCVRIPRIHRRRFRGSPGVLRQGNPAPGLGRARSPGAARRRPSNIAARRGLC